MNTPENQLKESAIRFFEGTISPDEEHELFATLKNNAEAGALFDQYEAEWAENHIPAAAVETQWQAFKQRIKSVSDAMPTARTIVISRKLMAAAAAAVLIIVSGLSVLLHNAYQQPETYVTCTAPMGGKAEVVLPDGSHVWLNAGSNLRYATSFGKNNRRVEMDGEGYFEIAKQNGERFVVNTKNYDIVIHGTKFNVSSYQDDPTSTTTLLEGSVQISRGNESMMMVPGETVTYDKQSQLLSKGQTAGNVSAWVENSAEFDNISMAELVKILSRKFNLRITIMSSKLAKERFAISLHNREDFAAIMRGINNIVPIYYKQDGRDVYLYQR